MMTTENSRADALTDALNRLVERWTTSMNDERAKRRVDSVGVAAGISGCIRDIRLILAASHVEQPAAALTAALNLLRETQKTPPNYKWALRRDSFLQSLAASASETVAEGVTDAESEAERAYFKRWEYESRAVRAPQPAQENDE